MKKIKAKTTLFNTNTFKKYLITAEGKEKATAKSMSTDVAKFFSYASAGISSKSTRYTDVLLNTQSLLSYLKFLKLDKRLAPTTIAEKLRRLHHAIDFTILQNKHNPTILAECGHAKLWWSKWAKSLSKNIKKQRIK